MEEHFLKSIESIYYFIVRKIPVPIIILPLTFIDFETMLSIKF